MDYLEKARRVFDVEILELQRLRQRLGDDFSRAVALIKDAVDARGKVVVVGVGKSGHIGGKIASTLTSTGSLSVMRSRWFCWRHVDSKKRISRNFIPAGKLDAVCLFACIS